MEYVYGTWQEGLKKLESGDIDLMPDVAYSDERDKIFAFHAQPVLSDWFQIYARRGSGINSLLDLSGKRVAVLNGSIQQTMFEKARSGFDIELQILPFPDNDDMFRAVKQGNVDAVVSNRFYGARHANQYDIADTAIIFSPTRLFYAASKSTDPKILDAIDANLAKFKSDPNSIYYRSLQRWTSETINVGTPRWLKISVLVAAGILALVFLWSVSLQRLVTKRTLELSVRNEDVARLYKELQDHAETLEKRVAERTEELNRMNRDLLHAKQVAEAADRTKSVFLAAMSHELRTPLNSVIGFTGILLQGLAGPLNDEQTKQLRIVKENGRHLLDLINDVLDISKIEAGQLEVSNKPFDLSESILKVMHAVQPLADKKKLQLSAEVAEDIGEIVSDRRRVEQVMLNLLSNAIKFTESGRVTLRCRKENGFAAISVTDTGCGIKSEHIDQLFQPFHQICTGLTRQHEGTGLGLAISRRLVEGLGGSISVESQWGSGSAFRFTLPIQQSEKIK